MKRDLILSVAYVVGFQLMLIDGAVLLAVPLPMPLPMPCRTASTAMPDGRTVHQGIT